MGAARKHSAQALSRVIAVAALLTGAGCSGRDTAEPVTALPAPPVQVQVTDSAAPPAFPQMSAVPVLPSSSAGVPAQRGIEANGIGANRIGAGAAGANPIGADLGPIKAENVAGTVFGTLGSIPEHAAAEHAAGVTGATLELDWSQYEPGNGVFSANYIAMIKNRLAVFRAAGQTMTLALGIHYTPGWVRTLPDAIAVDEHGVQLPGIDMVFSQPVRDAVAIYFAHLQQDLDLRNFTYIRLTSGGNAEMLYNTSGSYAAFSNAARNGQFMAAGMAPNPLPNWRPGTRGQRATQVRAWADWYVSALSDVTKWQIRVLDGLGFTGTYQTITPGAGVRPYEYDRAIRANLPDGLLGIGGAWARYYAGLAGLKRIMIYVSSIADGSAADNACAGTDKSAAVTSSVANPWSATRWQSRLADEYGFSKGGENPGYGDGIAVSPYYGDTSDKGMLAVALRQVESCGLTVFNWAHDEHLWREGPGVAAFAARIRALD
jgi:hypothetical protein